MFELLIQNVYWFMFMQVIVTLLVIPIMSFKRFDMIANAYCETYYPSAKSDVEVYKASRVKRLFIISAVCFLIGISVVMHATVSTTELFNWDNQAGMSILFLLAMIPVAIMAFDQKGLFALLKQHIGSKRKASLSPQKWQEYYPKGLLSLLLVGQLVFVSTIIYFAKNPFDGFAGYSNLIGLLIINLVFIATSLVLYRSKRMGAIQEPEQRKAIKIKAIKINTLVWLVAIYHLSISMWIAGLQLEGLKLLTQSVYLQLIIFLTAYTLSLPRPISLSKV
ncbi:hypothetical protein [Glaciecola petra]|uniref:DUF1648 domain-containing protein n=1 Tax=Glaciecola petra TaxID=3075602 RepID=A0ABU2ZSX9_9ALTE|nr:hypothetical protein [Aestuariibacter sp. P117]MDT0595743.1 hypothetical protein [Aestuariibacter sp. P117]